MTETIGNIAVGAKITGIRQVKRNAKQYVASVKAMEQSATDAATSNHQLSESLERYRDNLKEAKIEAQELNEVQGGEEGAGGGAVSKVKSKVTGGGGGGFSILEALGLTKMFSWLNGGAAAILSRLGLSGISAASIKSSIYAALSRVGSLILTGITSTLGTILSGLTIGFSVSVLIEKYFGPAIRDFASNIPPSIAKPLKKYLVGSGIAAVTAPVGRAVKDFEDGLEDGIINAIIEGLEGFYNEMKFRLKQYAASKIPGVQVTREGAGAGDLQTVGGGDIPFAAEGGVVQKTGAAVIHKGERVVPASSSSSNTFIFNGTIKAGGGGSNIDRRRLVEDIADEVMDRAERKM